QGGDGTGWCAACASFLTPVPRSPHLPPGGQPWQVRARREGGPLLNAVADALLPPASLAAAAFLLFLAGPRWRRLGLVVLAAFLALGTGLVAAALMASLTFSDAPPGPEPAAIVILSADGIVLPKPLTLQPGPLTMERMRDGAELHRRTGLPILVSGGSFLGDPTPLAAMMASSLKEDFGIDVRWQEDQSADTWQNAQFSASVLR